MLSNLELHRARLKALGGSAEERMQREKLKSLESALKYSYQSERVYKDGIEYGQNVNVYVKKIIPEKKKIKLIIV